MSLSSNPNSYAGDRKDKGQSSDASLNTLLNANNLDSYVLPSALSVTVARSHKKSYAVATTYDVGTLGTNSSTVSFVLTPGADYVYGPDSYFTFNFAHSANTASTDAWFGQYGSILNIFKSIRLTHASGTEIEYIDNLNLLNTYKLQYDRDDTYRVVDGSGFGATHSHMTTQRTYNDKAATGTDFKYSSGRTNLHLRGAVAATQPGGVYTVLPEAGKTHKFAVPLSMLSEFFNSDKLLPPYILAGMRIELELETPAVSTQSFTPADGKEGTIKADTTHTISGLNMQLDSHTLTDSVAKALSRMSANEGLDIHFPSWFHDRHALGSTSATVNITKALSRVEDICLIPRTTGSIAAGGKASLEAIPYVEGTTWQISIGSMFFPSHPVQSAWDAYRLAMQGRRHMCRIPFYQFAEEGLGVMRGALERSQILNGSGIAISATRGATVNVNMAAAATTTVDLFVRHTKLVSVFLDNVVVRT